MLRGHQIIVVATLGMALWEAIGLSARRPAPTGVSPSSRALVFIVHKSNPVDNLSLQDVRKIFLTEQNKWPDGHKVTLVMQEQGREERQALLRLLYRMSEGDYDRYVLQSAFRGAVQSSLRLLSSVSSVVKFVSFVPGAIGYVLSGEEDDSVKVIKVDGLTPEDADYKLRPR